MSNNKNHWVSKRDDGWAHKREGANRAARDAAKRDGGELFIKGRNGQIRDRNTYGKDPFPPEG